MAWLETWVYISAVLGLGHQVIKSAGWWEENRIGSNYGQLVARLIGNEPLRSPA